MFAEKAKNREIINNLNNKRNTTGLLPTSMSTSTAASQVKKVMKKKGKHKNKIQQQCLPYLCDNNKQQMLNLHRLSSRNQANLQLLRLQAPGGHLWGRRAALWLWAQWVCPTRTRTRPELQSRVWAWYARHPAHVSALRLTQRYSSDLVWRLVNQWSQTSGLGPAPGPWSPPIWPIWVCDPWFKPVCVSRWTKWWYKETVGSFPVIEVLHFCLWVWAAFVSLTVV